MTTIAVTLFDNAAATRKRDTTFTIGDLATRIKIVTATEKKRLPWLKLARFGNALTEKGSLRHDANLIALSGIEADYDAGNVSFDDACDKLTNAGIEAIVYTSPSHTEAVPRWRILAPFCTELPPDKRDHMMGRLNGLFGGIFATESWTLSQSYYYGSVAHNPVHRVEVIDGTPIDDHDELDEAWLGKPDTEPHKAGNGAHHHGRLDADAMRDAIRTGISYHPASVRLVGRWAQNGTPFLDAQQRLLDLFDEVPEDNRDARWQARRADVHRVVRDIYGKQADKEDAPERAKASANDAKATIPSFRDPWEASPPPEWPGGVFHTNELNDLVFQLHFRDGVDAGAQGMAMLTAASGAAPKNARLAPYAGTNWLVPPIVWTMVVADSGQRKTPVIANAFSALQAMHRETWLAHRGEMQKWRSLPAAERKKTPAPEQPHPVIVEDPTVESLQAVLAASPTDRGTCMLRDEIAGLFGFGRYNNGHGDAERAFYLQAFEAGTYTVHRIKRGTVFISCTGLTIFGCIQPDRLADFTGLESDGMLQRFNPIVCSPPPAGRPGVRTPGLPAFEAVIRRLARLDGMRYATDEEGEQQIRATERDGVEFTQFTDFGRGFQGYCAKLHGTHARVALILHLLNDPEQPVIPAATIERAGWLVRRFLLPMTAEFYASIPGSVFQRMQDIAGWVLTKAPDRILASDLATNVRACRSLSAKELNEAIDPLVTGGWMEPEEPYPTNRAWQLHPALRGHFADRAEIERARRAALRRLFQRIGSGGATGAPDNPDTRG
jgi:hypothetical protein